LGNFWLFEEISQEIGIVENLLFRNQTENQRKVADNFTVFA